MKTLLFVAAVLSFGAVTPGYAQEDSTCNEVSDGIWVCPLPTKPAVAPICHILGMNLVCNGPVVVPALPANKKPTNCGWNKAGKFVCW